MATESYDLVIGELHGVEYTNGTYPNPPLVVANDTQYNAAAALSFLQTAGTPVAGGGQYHNVACNTDVRHQ